MFHADKRTYGQTDVTKLIVAIRNFANAPKNCHLMTPELRHEFILIAIPLVPNMWHTSPYN